MKDRRELLKGLAVGSVWATPVVSSVVLPVHAETTTTTCVTLSITFDYGGGGSDAILATTLPPPDSEITLGQSRVDSWECLDFSEDDPHRLAVENDGNGGDLGVAIETNSSIAGITLPSDDCVLILVFSDGTIQFDKCPPI